ncbi:MAG: rod shape-determining protein MreC [Desulfosarcinaceae bacterium]|nr:rod shape-determining protein MreC [Desulfosarcinaceae bacterium]
MFSRKMVVIVGALVLIAASVIIISINSRRSPLADPTGGVAVGLFAPFQEAFTTAAGFVSGIWRNYFALVGLAEEAQEMRRQLSQAKADLNQYEETRQANRRLRSLLNFRTRTASDAIAAEVIGRDPSPWFKTIIINKGYTDGVFKASPVVVPEGIVGLVVATSAHFAKVLLIIDQNSAVDAKVQATRARGIVKGDPTGRGSFNYVLRKHEISLGDSVITSGLDGVFPKGLPIGRVSEIVRLSAGIFQEIAITPYVDFETLEEVLVLAPPERHDLQEAP